MDLSSQVGLAYDLKHLNKHLPGTVESERLLQKDGAAHVFTDKATLSFVEATIFERGESRGVVRGTARYGFLFDRPIGERVAVDGGRIPLHYGEMKLNPDGRYHIIPRTRPAQ